jgi:hypothetical protein
VLPPLAARIRRDFGSFVVSGHVTRDGEVADAPLTVSAGIFAGTAKFPLYRAADQAGEALSRAKRRVGEAPAPDRPPLIVKDAIHFLETTLGWEEYARVEAFALQLARLVDRGVPHGRRTDRAPRALLQLLGTVAEEYAAAGGGPATGPVYGRWMPMLAYGLRRMCDRAPSENQTLRAAIMQLGGTALDLTHAADAASWPMIRILAMPVRWAEFLTRRGS